MVLSVLSCRVQKRNFFISMDSKQPTSCGVCDGEIGLHGFKPNSRVKLTYILNNIIKDTTIRSNYAGNIVLSHLCPGNYSDIYYYQNKKKKSRFAVTLKQPSLNIPFSKHINPTSYSSCDGSIRLIGLNSGQEAKITYDLNGVRQDTITEIVAPDSSVNITKLCAGNYSNFIVTINNCTATLSSIILDEVIPMPTAAESLVIESPKNGYYSIPIFYGTDREETGSSTYSRFYGAKHINVHNSNLNEFGMVYVSIPFDHKTGELERPDWFTIGKPSPSKYILLLKIKTMEENTFCDKLRTAITQSENNEVFIFIHGFDNSFEDGALITAKLFYDMHYQGIPIMYSWSSQNGGPLSYSHDEEEADLSIERFKQFILAIIEKTGARKVNIISHSMGGRILAAALSQIEKENRRVKFNEIIFAAPDVYADKFAQDLAPNAIKICNKITVYSSDKDLALKSSSDLHKDHARIGQAGKNIFLMNNIETIDATNLKTENYIGHSYFSISKSVIYDIAKILETGLSANERGLTMMPTKIGNYWRFTTK